MITTDDQLAAAMAASLLDRAGRTIKHGPTAIRCLLAADQLLQAGAELRDELLGETELAALESALGTLSDLSPKTLDEPLVTDAIANALAAHAQVR